MVTILLFGHALQDSVGGTELQLDLTAPTTVKKLIESHEDRLGALMPFLSKGEVLVTVNRKVGTIDSPVRDGDTIKITHQTNPIFEGARWHNP
ncbi:MoaD/ThiS family protein [Candidatus Nitrospira bockiana]